MMAQEAPVSTILITQEATIIKLRSQLITEEWAEIHKWLAHSPGKYGDPSMFPDVFEWLDIYVPSFTDKVVLEINGDLVAVGLLDEEAHLHCLINPVCATPYLRAKHIKKSMLPYFTKRYKYLYTELLSNNEKSIKLAKYVGFEVLPATINMPHRRAAIIRK